MAVPTPESLAMDCEMKCDMCKESVNYGDDYRAHLQFAHSVTNNFPFFMRKALEKIKGEKRKEADVVTLEEESSGIRNSNSKESSSDGEETVDETFPLDPLTKEKIEKTVENCMDDLFKPIRSLLEGKEPLDLDPVDDMNEDYGDDPYAVDEKIWQSFENLKEIVNKIEFPAELLASLVSSKSDVDKTVDDEDDTLQERVALVPNISDKEPAAKRFKKPPTKKTSEVSASKEIPSSVAATPTPAQVVPHAPKVQQSSKSVTPSQPKLAPVRSDQSDISNNSDVGKNQGQTFFICPLESCTFYTSKQGMKGGKAASHLKESHGITGEDMKAAGPGAFKFKKVKGEPSSR